MSQTPAATASPSDPKAWTTLLVSLLAVAAGGWLGLAAVAPPDPVGTEAPATEFSAVRAMEHVEALASAPRPPGSAGHQRALRYLVEQLDSYGLEVEIDSHVMVGEFRDVVRGARLENVVARLGDRPDRPDVLLVSHYDSVAHGPGAGDAAAGVAALLETARILAAEGPLANDLLFLVTDGEELGLLGARAFVEAQAEAEGFAAMLNFEARGTGGASFLFETSGGNRALVEAFAESVPNPVGTSYATEVYRRMPNNTDFSALRSIVPTGLNFAFFDEAASYHTTLDTPGRLDLSSLQHHGDIALGMARRLGDAPDLPLPRNGDAIFWNPWPGALWVFPSGLAIPTALAFLVLTFVLLATAGRRGVVTAGKVILGLLGVLGSAVVSVALVMGANQLELAILGDPRLIRWSEIDSFFGAAVLLVILASLMVLGPLGRKVGREALQLGALLLVALLAVGTALAMPGASYLFVLPALFAAATLAWGLRGGGAPGPVATAVLAFVVGWLWVPVAKMLALALGSAAAIPLAILLALVLALLVPHLEAATIERRPAFVLCALIGGAIGLGVVTHNFDAEHPRTSSLAYVFDADSGQAQWVSAHRPNPWTADLVGDERQDLESLFFLPGLRGYVGEASAVALELPSVERLDAAPQAGDTIDPMAEAAEETATESSEADSDVADGEVGTTEEGDEGDVGPMRLRIVPGNGAQTLRLRITSEQDIPTIQLAGESPRERAGEKSRDWRVVMVAPPRDGLELTLATVPGQQVKLEILDQDDGLPTVEGEGPAPRPVTLRPSVYSITDASLVRREVTLVH